MSTFHLGEGRRTWGAVLAEWDHIVDQFSPGVTANRWRLPDGVGQSQSCRLKGSMAHASLFHRQSYLEIALKRSTRFVVMELAIVMTGPQRPCIPRASVSCEALEGPR